MVLLRLKTQPVVQVRVLGFWFCSDQIELQFWLLGPWSSALPVVLASTGPGRKLESHNSFISSWYSIGWFKF